MTLPIAHCCKMAGSQAYTSKKRPALLASTAKESEVMHKAQQLTLLGASGLVVGALLPWVKVTTLFGTLTKAGYEGDGLITGAIGVLLLVGALLHRGKPGQRYSVASAIFGMLVAAVVLFDYTNVASAIADTVDTPGVVDAAVGPGLYLTAVAALLVVVGGWHRVPETAARPQEATSSASAQENPQ